MVTGAVLIALAARQAWFVHRYAVDVLFWDSWDLYNPLFHGQGWWASFDYQHGPHRQGVGGLLIRAFATRTRWDTRYDAATVCGALIAAAIAAVWLAWRCGVRSWPLAAVPVVCLNARQYTMLIASANPSHGALPVLLFTLYALTWFVRSTAVRLTLLVLLTTALIFTGFGLFVGLLTPPLLYFEATAARRGDRRRARAAAVAVGCVLLAWAAFAWNYRADPASLKFHFPADRPVEYAYFVGSLLANFAGLGTGLGTDPAAPPTAGEGVTIAVGLALAAVVGWVCVDRGRRAFRAGVVRDRTSVVLFCLSAYGLLFAANAAVGRVPEGWRTAAAPRYVTLGIPAALAVVIHFGSLPRAGLRWTTVAVAGLVAAGTVTLYGTDRRAAVGLHDGCLRWRDAYLATGDEVAADRRADFAIYEDVGLTDRLAYLRRNGLNLFDPDVYPIGSKR